MTTPTPIGKSKLLLTKEEMTLISQIATDLATGNHLLRPRSEKYKQVFKQFAVIVEKSESERTLKESQMCEYLAACQSPEADALFNKKYF